MAGARAARGAQEVSGSAINISMKIRELLEHRTLDEMPLQQFTPIGDFDKPGPFRGVDRRLVPHPKNQLKAAKFFERTPYDFRLFFSNIPGTGKYSEYGAVSAERLKVMFGEVAETILKDSDDTITVVFVGNSGDAKVMMTPWIMAHRFAHAIQSAGRGRWSLWGEAEKHFFSSVNDMLSDYYGKSGRNDGKSSVNWSMTQEYNALFNAIGTQRSSRTNQIRRPYEFLYELFAQYIGTGEIKLGPLPDHLGYGKKAWGKSTNYLKINPEDGDEDSRREATSTLANDMKYMFDPVLGNSVGKIFVM